MEIGPFAQADLFDESVVVRVELPAAVPMDANCGISKRFKSFGPAGPPQ